MGGGAQEARQAALAVDAAPFGSAGKKATLRFSVRLEMHEWLLTCLDFVGCWSSNDKSRRKTGAEPPELYRDCWVVAWHYQSVVLTVVSKIEESSLSSWTIEVDPAPPIGAIAGSIDAATRKADPLRTHPWELVPGYVGESLAL